MGHYHDVTEELRGPYDTIRRLLPHVTTAYADLNRAAMKEGELSTKTKELIALAIAITRECDGCISAHARNAARRGVSERELAEMVAVAIMMNGGPGTVWGPRAMAAYQEYAQSP